MTVVFSRPYQFVPPDSNRLWPALIQQFRLVDFYLKRKEGVVSYDCQNLELAQESLQRGDGIIWAPNHARYSDPLALGWAARQLKTAVFAMASWHLFNDGWFGSWAIRRMGGFSIFREGTDRKSIETTIKILAGAQRPLILFPEGTTSRTNDHMMPLLDGVTFMARSAARRRAKECGGKVVLHPVGIKYLCDADVRPWAREQLSNLEQHFGWYKGTGKSIRKRTVNVAEAMLTLKEIEYLGSSQSGDLPQRRDTLIEHILSITEKRLGLEADEQEGPRSRIRQIRGDTSTRFFDPKTSDEERERLRIDAARADLAQELMSYLECYLLPETATDTRIVETIHRMQENLFGKFDRSMPLKSVIRFDQAIEVPPAKAPRDKPDPILETVAERLQSIINELATAAQPIKDQV